MNHTQAKVIASLATVSVLGAGMLVVNQPARADDVVPQPAYASESGLASRPLLPANAPEPANAADSWHIRMGLPLWIPALRGDIAVKDRELSPDQSTGDAAESFFSTLDGAFALHAEAEKGRFGLLADAMYVSLGDEKDTRTGGEVEWSLEAFIGELCGYYILVEPKPGAKGWGAFRADLLAGARVSHLGLGLDARRFDVDSDKTLLDPIIGGRIDVGLLDWLSYKLRGDIGGFGISNDTSDLVWNIDTAVEFHVARWMDIDLGYRWLNYDFGTDDLDFDATLQGPYVMVQFRI